MAKKQQQVRKPSFAPRPVTSQAQWEEIMAQAKAKGYRTSW